MHNKYIKICFIYRVNEVLYPVMFTQAFNNACYDPVLAGGQMSILSYVLFIKLIQADSSYNEWFLLMLREINYYFL